MSFFKSEDFNGDLAGMFGDGTADRFPALNGTEKSYVANKANSLLEAHLKTLPRVYSDQVCHVWDKSKEGYDDHTALLWGVEEIKDGDKQA